MEEKSGEIGLKAAMRKPWIWVIGSLLLLGAGILVYFLFFTGGQEREGKLIEISRGVVYERTTVDFLPEEATKLQMTVEMIKQNAGKTVKAQNITTSDGSEHIDSVRNLLGSITVRQMDQNDIYRLLHTPSSTLLLESDRGEDIVVYSAGAIKKGELYYCLDAAYFELIRNCARSGKTGTVEPVGKATDSTELPNDMIYFFITGMLEQFHDGYLAYGVTYEPSPQGVPLGRGWLYCDRYDGEGNLLWRREYEKISISDDYLFYGYYYGMNGLTLLSDGGYAMVLSSQAGEQEEPVLKLCRFDGEGRLLFEKAFGDTETVGGVVDAGEGQLIFVSNMYTQSTQEGEMIVEGKVSLVSKSGRVSAWRKLSSSSTQSWLGSVRQMPDGNFLTVVSSYTIGMEKNEIQLLCFDKNLSERWRYDISEVGYFEEVQIEFSKDAIFLAYQSQATDQHIVKKLSFAGEETAALEVRNVQNAYPLTMVGEGNILITFYSEVLEEKWLVLYSETLEEKDKIDIESTAWVRAYPLPGGGFYLLSESAASERLFDGSYFERGSEIRMVKYIGDKREEAVYTGFRYYYLAVSSDSPEKFVVMK